MKLCKFLLVLSLFCGVFTWPSSTNGSCGLPLALIEQDHGDGLFNEPEVCKHARSRRRLCQTQWGQGGHAPWEEAIEL